jgi:hypothetical protein
LRRNAHCEISNVDGETGKAPRSRRIDSVPCARQGDARGRTWQVPTEILLVNWLNDEDPQAMAKWLEMK